MWFSFLALSSCSQPPRKNHDPRLARLKAETKAETKRRAAAKAAKTARAKAKAKALGVEWVEPPKKRSPAEVKLEGELTEEEDSDEEAGPLKRNQLPPINEIGEIFADLVKNAPGLADFARFMEGQTIKVATMCSGTESPLLALELISDSVKAQTGVKLRFTHGFSCEIDPWKQAYIERNFAPSASRPPSPTCSPLSCANGNPLLPCSSPGYLFADVTELGQEYAHNAYGAEIKVPIEGYTMLVAGTSCVDFSNLNRQGKSITDKGESGRTWQGMLAWTIRARPMIVILENIVSAPWARMVADFEEIGYSALSLKCVVSPDVLVSGPLLIEPTIPLSCRALQVRHQEVLHPAHADARVPGLLPGPRVGRVGPEQAVAAGEAGAQLQVG